MEVVKQFLIAAIGALFIYAFMWSSAILCVASGGSIQACGV